MRKAAVRAILARARAVMGSSGRESHTVLAPLSTRPAAELDIEQTLDNLLENPHLSSSQIAVQYRQQKRVDCALMLDTSLSMTGKKLALMAVGAAVLALKLPSEDFAVVSFESTARSIKQLGVAMPVEQLIIKVLEVPALGYTNIQAGLDEGLRQMNRGRHSKRSGILLSDGKYTVGGDPVASARRYSRLHVVLLGDFNTDPKACAAMAAAGRGRVYEARTFESLPRILHRLVTELLS